MAEYFVKTDGDDSKNGLSLANAWKTIGKAEDNAVAGDTVRVQEGTYLELVDHNANSGDFTDGMIIFYAEGNVIIDAENTRANCLTGDQTLIAYLPFNDSSSWDFKRATAENIYITATGKQWFFMSFRIQLAGTHGFRGNRGNIYLINGKVDNNSLRGIYDYVNQSGTEYFIMGVEMSNNGDEGCLVRCNRFFTLFCNTHTNLEGVSYLGEGALSLFCNSYGNEDAGWRFVNLSTFTAIFINNIISNSGNDAGVQLGANNIILADYNCLYNNVGGTYVGGTGRTAGKMDITDDPKYVNPPTDFSLQASSLCIDTATPTANGIGIKNGGYDMGALQTGTLGNPIISNQQLDNYSIDITGNVVASCDVTDMTANDEVYVEINGNVWKLDTDDNAAYSLTIKGGQIGSGAAMVVKFIAKNASGAAESTTAPDTLTVSAVGSMYTRLRDRLLAKLQTISKIQDTTNNILLTFTGVPAVTITPSDQESVYETNQDNERIYGFNINLYYEFGEFGAKNSLNALFELVDEVLDEFDQDPTLTGISMPTGYQMITVIPTFTTWEEVPERKLLKAIISTQVRISVDVT